MRVLLASDGLWRLVDLFNSHGPLDVLQAIDTHGWPAVLTELRAREDGDTGASRYARVKHRDDASAVLAHVRQITKPLP
jgi:hypothetical protein